MKRRLTSTLILISFGIMAITGLWLALFPHANTTAAMHLLFGILFLGAAIFHLINNRLALKSYLVDKRRRWVPITRTMLLLTLAGALLSAGVLYRVKPIYSLYEWSTALRISQKQNAAGQKMEVVVHQRNQEAFGTGLAVEMLKGPFFRWPTYAIWVEDTARHYLQTVYVTGKLAKNNFYVKVIEENGIDKFVAEPDTKGDRERPEALPVWGHRYGKKSSKGNFVPDDASAIPDAYTGATMLTDFRLETKTEQPLPQVFDVYMEVNQSFDWNDHYAKDRFPNDPVYTGNGKPGQPSLIYHVRIDQRTRQNVYAMQLIGRGHHSGADGDIHLDLEGISTARGIVKRLLVEIPEASDLGTDQYPYDKK